MCKIFYLYVIINFIFYFLVSVISKIDKKIILEKYEKTALIEANGGQMIKVNLN